MTAEPTAPAVTVTRPQRRRPTFHPLPVAAVDPLTDEAVVVSFSVPPELRETFAFTPGQHLTVRRFDPADGTEIRRSYSICSTPSDLVEHGRIRVGIRAISGGAFSSFVTRQLAAGASVEVLPPLGHFTTALNPARTRHYAAIAAGSGITPVLSLLASALAIEPDSRFTLLYGNRRAATVMFAEELADLKDRYRERLHVIHVLSREPQMSALLSGRIDADRLRAILDAGLVEAAEVDEWFLCGPYGMVIDAQGVLAELGIPDKAVHTELFHVPEQGESTRAADPGSADERDSRQVTVTIMLDGRESTFTMPADGRILDAALGVRGELPYACKGGVCSTCRAKVVAGKVSMAQNYALEPDEVADGYVLTCQSSPVTDQVVIDYDA
ncbi:MAG TPA: 1,2-phenylacetyl-CoA epoxidase subunit PaaE [Micromonosporaceae bacterium]